jgi:hypothetical protein
VRLAHEAVERVAQTSPNDLDLDPASTLFFEFAAPLLLTAQTEEQFQTASSLADFVWASTHFDARTQIALISEFIEESNIPDDMIPWLMDVYSELAARKAALLGE